MKKKLNENYYSLFHRQSSLDVNIIGDKINVNFPPVFWNACEVVTSLFNYFYHHHQRERSANFYCQSLKAPQTFQIIGGILRSRKTLMLAIKSLGMTMMNITSNFDLYLGTSWTDEKDGGDRGGRRTQILTTDKFLGMVNWLGWLSLSLFIYLRTSWTESWCWLGGKRTQIGLV